MGEGVSRASKLAPEVWGAMVSPQCLLDVLQIQKSLVTHTGPGAPRCADRQGHT